MCPPGKLHYFYSNPKTLIFDELYEIAETKKEKNVKYINVDPVVI